MFGAIKKHVGDFAAIVAMAVIAIGIGAYIVYNQDARPAIPLIEDTPVKMEAEFSDAQAVVPGQGQSVRISGVEVGKIGAVELEDGLAVVSMNIEPDYAERIYQNASALLRPRTGLKDMFIELDPGSSTTPPLGENGRIPVQNTAPDIDPDEILAALDSDTRSYLQLLVSGAGKGLDNNGDDLREVFERLEPLHRDLAAVQGAVADRRAALSRLIHNYGELTTELAKSPEDLQRIVTSSNEVFTSLAAVDGGISESIARLPSALNTTESTLAKVDRLGGVLGPTLDDLRPAARQLDVANREVLPLVREGEPILRNEIRPFVRQARPYVDDLRPAAIDLADAAPDLTTGFGQLNRFFNMLAFNPDTSDQANANNPRIGQEPPGADPETDRRDEGYLYWLDWVANNGVSLHSTSDASGPIRRGTFSVSCTSLLGLLARGEGLAALLPEILGAVPLGDQPDILAALGLGGTGTGILEQCPLGGKDEKALRKAAPDSPADGGEPVAPDAQGAPATKGADAAGDSAAAQPAAGDQGGGN